MPEPIGRDRLLIVVSAAQLATGVAGMAIGLRRRHPYDVFWMHGDADTIGRDAIFKGTALSAPVSNMVIQAAMTGVMARWPSRLAAQALGGWWALLVAGYLGERLVRQRLRPSGLGSCGVTAAHGVNRTGSGHGRAQPAGRQETLTA